MSQKQQTTPTNKYLQGFKGRRKGNSNNRDIQSKGGGKSDTNTYIGNTIRTQEQKRKTVFKAALDSPFNITWPSVSNKDQTEILDALCETLSVIEKPPVYKKVDADNNSLDKVDESCDTSFNKMDDILISRERSTIRSNICFGINEVTKHLERMIDPHHLISTNPNHQLSTSSISKQYHSLEMIFVCKADILPQFYSHFPTMCNIAGDVLLVPLPSGASRRISDVVNFKRISCIGVKTNTPEFTRIYRMVKEKVKPVNAPWLNPLKPPEILSNKRKIIGKEVVHDLKKEKLEESTYSLSNIFDQEQMEVTCDDKPKIKVEVASSHTALSPSIFFFEQQPQLKIEPTLTQLKQTKYVSTQIKQLITTAPANKNQAKEKRKEKKLKYKQKKMNIK